MVLNGIYLARVCQEGCVIGLNKHDCNLPAAAQQRADCAQTASLPSNRMASWLRIKGQFGMGLVHFFSMSMVAR